MRKSMAFITCLVVIAAFGVSAAGASAYSLGPAGTQVSAEGSAGNPTVGRYGGTFVIGNGIYVDCSSAQESGTLDGSAAVTLAVAFSGCSAPGSGLTGTTTVSAPGGMRLSVISSAIVEGQQRYYGQLTTGPSGMTITIGACTVTVPANLPLVSATDAKRLVMGNGTTGAGVVMTPRTVLSSVEFNPYTGSAGCPAEVRGSHSTGFGLNYWQLGSFKGMKIS
jgi:hypothetical protein